MYGIIGDKVTLKFALKMDMRRIYEMMVSDEVSQFMYNEDYPAPTWEDFRKDKEVLFPEMASRSGSYLMVYYEGKMAGVVSYQCGYEKESYAELDLWLAGYEFMGKSIGCHAIDLLRSYINKSYRISHFIIRPWTRNLSAIQSYNRCGFYEKASFNLGDYYSDEEMALNGEGAYGQHETLNLYCHYSEQKV